MVSCGKYTTYIFQYVHNHQDDARDDFKTITEFGILLVKAFTGWRGDDLAGILMNSALTASGLRTTAKLRGLAPHI